MPSGLFTASADYQCHVNFRTSTLERDFECRMTNERSNRPGAANRAEVAQKNPL